MITVADAGWKRWLMIKMILHVFTDCHNDVVKIVELACKHNVCLIPYGGESLVKSKLLISIFTGYVCTSH